MELKFDITTHRMVPDFYVIGGHGCGRLSLSYYLNWMGAPVFPEGNLFPTLENISIPVLKNPFTYAFGLTIDQISGHFGPINSEPVATPALWLVRDPIQIMVSLFNYFLGDAVFGRGNALTLGNEPILPFLSKHISVCNLFDTLKRSINTTATPLVVETPELLPDACAGTLKKIAAYLRIPYTESVAEIASIPFNTYDNRLWSRQPAKSYPISAFYYVAPLYVAPDKIFDFWFNQWSPAHTLFRFTYKGRQFTAGMPRERYEKILPSILENFFNEEKIEATKTYIDVWEEHCALTRKLYKQYSITAEDAVEAIRKNPRFRSRYLRFMENELKEFSVNYPGIVSKWKYFNSI